MLHSKFHVPPPQRAASFRADESRHRFCFLQVKYLLHLEVAIRASLERNFQGNICCVTSCTKTSPVSLVFENFLNSSLLCEASFPGLYAFIEYRVKAGGSGPNTIARIFPLSVTFAFLPRTTGNEVVLCAHPDSPAMVCTRGYQTYFTP